jgi:hypothetical protein
MQKDSTNRNDSKRTTTFFCNSFVPFQVRSSGIDDERVVLQDHYVSECQHPFLSLSSFSSGDGLLLCSLCFFLDLQRRAENVGVSFDAGVSRKLWGIFMVFGWEFWSLLWSECGKFFLCLSG